MICWFKLGLFNAILEASRILQICLFSGGAENIFHENLWFSFKYFAGLKSLVIFSCSSHHNSMLHPTLPMYVCSKTHTPSYITHASCRFLLFSLNSCFILFAVHFILILYELLVSSWNFLMKCFKKFDFWNNLKSQQKLTV